MGSFFLCQSLLSLLLRSQLENRRFALQDDVEQLVQNTIQAPIINHIFAAALDPEPVLQPVNGWGKPFVIKPVV